MCELCEANVANFNQHMKKSHPGCGRSANRQGYRSNGSYVDGWFGGECGSGNPYYLLCGGCREKYLAIKSKAKVPIVERYAHLTQSIGPRNPVLLPQFECDRPSQFICYQQDETALSVSVHFGLPFGQLLQEKKVIVFATHILTHKVLKDGEQTPDL